MSFEWPMVTIGDVAKIKHGFAFKGEFFIDEPSPNILVTPGNFAIGGGFQPGKSKYYAGPLPDNYVLRGGEIVITMTDLSKASDTLGYAAKVPTTPGVTYWHNQRVGLLQVIDDSRASKDWLHYLMRTREYRSWVIGSATGTTVKHSSPSRIESFPFKLPPLEIQCEIAATLGALDDRIDNLRATNATLEAIAQAIFKSWFIDFDPVRAKMEGREPEGMDAETAALFPSEFEESELGLIPKGWKIMTFGDLAIQRKGSVSPSAHPHDTFCHYSLPAFDSEQRPITELGDAIKSNKTPVPPDSVLVSKLNPHIPRIWHVCDSEKNSVCSTEFLVWTAKPGFSSAFVYCVASSPEFNSGMRQLVTGTSNSHQRVKPDQLAAARAVVSNEKAARAFEVRVSALLRKVEHSRRCITGLAALRDHLLPRLISGRLRIDEAQEAVEAA